MIRPNFLFIVTDQHRADHLGCYGAGPLRTPSIDSIARRGMAKDRAYVAAPVCMPNRSTLITGRMPSAHGARIKFSRGTGAAAATGMSMRLRAKPRDMSP